MAKDERGFENYGEVIDAYGATVLVNEASADPLIHGWLRIDGGALSNNHGHALLTVSQARQIVMALNRFIFDKTQESR